MPHEEYGQNETLISSIRNIIKDYPSQSIFKEFLQNADDAGATRYHVMVDTRSHPTNSLFYPKMKAWQGPAILIFNNAKFKKSDFESLMQIRVGGKQDDDTKIGKHGLGFNSCYHFTDVPSFISGDTYAFLDPQEKFLGRRGIKGDFPKNGIDESSEKDQFIPFQGVEGLNFRSTFEGTLFRIPLRKEPSDISDSIFTADDIRKLFIDIKSNVLSQFLFLRNIEKIEISCISAPLEIISLWKAETLELDENVRTKRKHINNGENQIYQIKINLNDNVNNRQIEDHWIVINGAQQDPEDYELKKYTRRYRLRVLGGVAAPLKISQNTSKDIFVSLLSRILSTSKDSFTGRMYSFFSLPDATHLPVHLNGTWAQGSDRGKLLLENDDLPDLDHLKLRWNRHILLNFLPELYCNLLKEIIKLHKSGNIDLENDNLISKFWPFPSATRNYPKYIIEYGFKVLKFILQNDEIFQLINDDNIPNSEEDRVDILFKSLQREQIIRLAQIVRNNRDELNLRYNPDLRSMIRLFPIWPELPDPTQPYSEKTLKPASHAYILPSKFKNYRTKINSKTYLDSSDEYIEAVLTDLDVPLRDIYSYTFEDVEFPDEFDIHYLHFLTGIISYNDNRVVQDLKTKRCFPTLTEKPLKPIDKLYDNRNDVFRAVFNDNMDMFIHPSLIKHSKKLANIGLKVEINQKTFIECAKHIDNLQKKREPPADIRYRGFILIKNFYEQIEDFHEDIIDYIKFYKFVPISNDLGKPYNINKDYSTRHQAHVMDFNNVILPKYREVAWSQMSLMAEDVVPPEEVLQEYPSLGKPEAVTVIEHLRFLYKFLRNDDEWKKNWDGVFKNNVYDIYEWLEKECSDNKDIYLSEIIRDEPLFLNFKTTNQHQDPFNANNWVAATNLVLNSEPNEKGYVDPFLSKYPTMLKSAGAKEVQRPVVEINVRSHGQSQINKNTMIEFLLEQDSPLNDFTFIVNNENIKAGRYVLAASSKFFRKKLNPIFKIFRKKSSESTITVKDVEPNSVRIMLRYLYGQDIDEAIESLNCIDDEDNNHSKITLYKNLLKLAEEYELGHLKELMELRISRLVTRSNAEDFKKFALVTKADQLKKFCTTFIQLNNRNSRVS